MTPKMKYILLVFLTTISIPLSADINLSSGDSDLFLATSSNFGSWDWVFESGGNDQSYFHWLYYRLDNDSQEFKFPVPDIETVDNSGEFATITWNDVDGRGLFSAIWKIYLIDTPGNTSRIETELEIININAVNIELNIFEYTDLDLDGTTQNETIDWVTPYVIRQDDESNNTFVEIGAQGYNNWEVGNYLELKNRMEDGNIDDLGNIGAPYVGDAGNIFQWNFILEPFEVKILYAGFSGNSNYQSECTDCDINNPTINLTASILNQQNEINIIGTGFSFGGDVELTISGNGSLQSLNPTPSSLGSFTITIDWSFLNIPGIYYVQAYDVDAELNTTTLSFLVEGQQSSDLVITKDFDNLSYNEFENFSISWKDKLIYDPSNTDTQTGQRPYEYHLQYSQDGGTTWLEPIPASGSSIIVSGVAYVDEYLSLSAQIAIPNLSSNTLIRVLDWNDQLRFDISDAFEIVSDAGSPHVDIKKKFDYSFPIDNSTAIALIDEANGVAADGVARLYLKVVNNTQSNPVTSMTVQLVDEDDGHGTSAEMLGKIQEATIITEYTDEANSAFQTQLTVSVNPNTHEYYIWYVAPDDFNQGYGSYNSRSSRTVTAKFNLEYQDGYIEEVSKKIEIVRPPLMLIHGLGGNSNTWDQFKYFSDVEQKFIEGSEFTVSKAVNILPNATFNENAQLLLNSQFKNAQTNANGNIIIEPNSYQGIIFELRRKGYAANQIDCITHSMGGSVVRESFLIGDYYNNLNSEAYNNYGRGYINKFISLHTPHNGSPYGDFLEDWLDDLSDVIPCSGGELICDLKYQAIEYLGEEIIGNYVLNNPNSFINTFIRAEDSGNILTGFELSPTEAVLDLRVNDGRKFSEVTTPSHAIAGDIMPGSIPDYTNLFQNALQIGNDFNEFIQRFMDFFYANVDVPTANEIPNLPQAQQDFWNGLETAKNISDKASRYLQWFELFMSVYQGFNFIQNSDLIVSVESQLSSLDPTSQNVTVNDNVWHSNSRGPIQNTGVGNQVFDLLNDGVGSATFNNLPSTFNSFTDDDANKSLNNGLDPSTLFIRKQPGQVVNGLQINEPLSNSTIEVGDPLNISVSLNDTVGLQHVSIYFQHEGYFFTAPWSNTEINLSIQCSATALDTQRIVAVGLYDFNEALGMDSTAYSTDEIGMKVLPGEILQDFTVNPMVNYLSVGEIVSLDYLAIYETFVAPINAFDTDLTAQINDVSMLSFNEASKEFEAVSQGSTFVDVSYKGSTTRIYFIIEDYNYCRDQIIINNKTFNQDTVIRARDYIELNNVTVNQTKTLELIAPKLLINTNSVIENGSELYTVNEDGCIDTITNCINYEWLQIGSDIDGEEMGDLFGRSVAFSDDGESFVAGATFNDGGGFRSGHVRIYYWDGTSWVQKGNDINGSASNDNSGTSVAISQNGNIVAIGSNLNDSNGTNSGEARVFEWDGTSWSQKGSSIIGLASLDFAGRSVSLSDNGLILTVGSNGNDLNGSLSGQVRVFEWDGSDWLQIGNAILGEAAFDQSGSSTSSSSNGHTIAVGAFDNDSNGESSGQVRIFKWDGTNWMQKGNDIDGENWGDQFGVDVGISSNGNVIVSGGIGNDDNGDNSGQVRVFEWNGSIWVQKGNDINGDLPGDFFGWSVSTSNDGNTIVLGAQFNDSNGNSSGLTKVYSWDGSNWLQLGQSIIGEFSDDQSGYDVSISGNGERIIIGAPNNDGNGSSSGHVRIYQLECID